jgi:hypothetical protein
MKPIVIRDRSRFEALSVARLYWPALGQPVARSQSSQKRDNLCRLTFSPTEKRDLAESDLDRASAIAYAQFKCHSIVISLLSGNFLSISRLTLERS